MSTDLKTLPIFQDAFGEKLNDTGFYEQIESDFNKLTFDQLWEKYQNDFILGRDELYKAIQVLDMCEIMS